MNVYSKTEIDSQTQKTNLLLPKRKEVEKDKLGVWDQQIQTTTYKIENIKDLLYSTGNST